VPDELAELPIVTELGEALLAGFARAEVRRPRGRLAALALAAALAVTLAIVSTLGGAALRPAQASAATVLRSAADAAAAQPDRFPKAGQFYFVSSQARYLAPIRRDAVTPLPVRASVAPVAIVTLATWVAWSPSRSGRIRSVVRSITFPSAAARARWVSLGRPALAPSDARERIAPTGGVIEIGGTHGALTVPAMLALPTRPTALYRALLAGQTAPQAVNIVLTMGIYPLPPRLRAGLYRALAMVRGLALRGRVRMLTGAVGVALGARDPDGLVEDEVVLDPHTGTLLGERSVAIAPAQGLAAGTVRYESVIVARAITNRPAPPRR